jgi:hypothetical protein
MEDEVTFSVNRRTYEDKTCSKINLGTANEISSKARACIIANYYATEVDRSTQLK